MTKQWYEELFANYAEKYDQECFTSGTKGEVDFIESEIGGDRSKKILDVGCGTGRHAIELAKRGYSVTGFDLSEAQLKRARQKAAAENVRVRFLQADARDFRINDTFDVVIMICEGAFSLMETDEMNFRILKSASRVLKPSGKFIFTALNALFPLFHSVEEFLQAQGQKVEGNTFDLMTFRYLSTYAFTDDDDETKTLSCNERFFAPTEISWMLKSLKFRTIAIHGCDIGDFRRDRPLTANDHEMLVVAER